MPDDIDEEAREQEDEEDIQYDDFSYSPEEMVAVRTPDEDPCPFWLGKIRTVAKRRNGVVSRLNILWYECRGNDPYSSPYKPAKIDGVVWTGTTIVNTVLMRFSSLKTDSRLSSTDSKKLRASLTQV